MEAQARSAENSDLSPSVLQNVLVKGKVNMNRAFDGDSVAVEILPEAEWDKPSTRLPDQQAAEPDEADPDASAHVPEVRSSRCPMKKEMSLYAPRSLAEC
jgi:exosome complex exonuclease DIS3/RRP44